MRAIHFLRRLEREIRARRNAVPKLNGKRLEVLRGIEYGRTLLVHGNGPSSIKGLEFVMRMYGDDLVVIGMNASPKFAKPDYYVLLDRKATLLYGDCLNYNQCNIVLSDGSFSLVNKDLRKSDLPLYERLNAIAKSGRYFILDRSTEFILCEDLCAAPRHPANAGIVSFWLALLLLSPKPGVSNVDAKGVGRVVLIGLDGYSFDRFAPFHIFDKSSPPGDRMEANMIQSAFLAQLFLLARVMGVEVLNLSSAHVLPVNLVERNVEFDKYFDSCLGCVHSNQI